jgi:hypothetical protein
LVNSEYKDKTVKIEDSCGHCDKPISLEIKDGSIIRVDPETVWIQRGGG